MGKLYVIFRKHALNFLAKELQHPQMKEVLHTDAYDNKVLDNKLVNSHKVLKFLGYL